MFVFDLETGSVSRHLVTHGVGSEDQSRPQYAASFSNRGSSKQTSLGFYFTGSQGVGPNIGPYVALKGLDKTNSNASRREVVFHGDSLVNPIFRGYKVRSSEGCPAVSNKDFSALKDKLANGAVFYHHHLQLCRDV
jgi:hypothetical protein